MASTSLDHAISARTHPSILANLHPEVRDQSAVVVLIDMLCQAEIPEKYPVDVVNCKYTVSYGVFVMPSSRVLLFEAWDDWVSFQTSTPIWRHRCI